MHQYLSLVVMSLILLYGQIVHAEYVEGYIIVNERGSPPTCLIQVTDFQEGSKLLFNDTIDDPEASGCDIVVLKTGDDATYELGGFTIQFKESGKYVFLKDYHFSLSDYPQEFFAYNFTYDDVENEDLSEMLGLAALVNSKNYSDSVRVFANNGLGLRCVEDEYNVYYYEYDDYGYWTSRSSGVHDCRSHFWFIEVNSTSTTTLAEMSTTTELMDITETTESSAGIRLTGVIEWLILPLLLLLLK